MSSKKKRLSPQEVKQAQLLYSLCIAASKIARHYGVTTPAILYHVAPVEQLSLTKVLETVQGDNMPSIVTSKESTFKIWSKGPSREIFSYTTTYNTLARTIKVAIITGRSLTGADFSNKCISSIEIEGASFFHVNFKKSTLKHISFKNCTFMSCNFFKAQVKNVIFDLCTFDTCVFYKSNLVSMAFNGCDINATRYIYTKLNNVIFKGSRLNTLNFSNSRMCNVLFNQVQASTLYLNHSSIKESSFYKSYLSDLSLVSISPYKSFINDCTIRGITYSTATPKSSDLAFYSVSFSNSFFMNRFYSYKYNNQV